MSLHIMEILDSELERNKFNIHTAVSCIDNSVAPMLIASGENNLLLADREKRALEAALKAYDRAIAEYDGCLGEIVRKYGVKTAHTYALRKNKGENHETK